MKIEKVKCVTHIVRGIEEHDTNKCHSMMVEKNPNVVSIFHTPNEHLCFEKNDYNKNGSIKKSEYEKVKSQVKNHVNISIADKEFV